MSETFLAILKNASRLFLSFSRFLTINSEFCNFLIYTNAISFSIYYQTHPALHFTTLKIWLTNFNNPKICTNCDIPFQTKIIFRTKDRIHPIFNPSAPRNASDKGFVTHNSNNNYAAEAAASKPFFNSSTNLT